MANEIFSASQIVGKSLFARTAVPLKRLPTNAAPVVFTVEPGANVGTVYSWIAMRPGERNNLYWMFYDSNNKAYYAEHLPGRFTTDELKDQGALTVKEQVEAEAAKNESTKDFIEKMVKYVVVGILIAAVAKPVLTQLVGKIGKK